MKACSLSRLFFKIQGHDLFVDQFKRYVVSEHAERFLSLRENVHALTKHTACHEPSSVTRIVEPVAVAAFVSPCLIYPIFRQQPLSVKHAAACEHIPVCAEILCSHKQACSAESMVKRAGPPCIAYPSERVEQSLLQEFRARFTRDIFNDPCYQVIVGVAIYERSAAGIEYDLF